MASMAGFGLRMPPGRRKKVLCFYWHDARKQMLVLLKGGL